MRRPSSVFAWWAAVLPAIAVGAIACADAESSSLPGGGGAAPSACTVEGASEYCYGGPAAARGVGICNDGTRTCSEGVWGPCEGYGEPLESELCNDFLDNDCNGVADEGCACTSGSVKPCYQGPANTRGIGICADGEQACVNQTWDARCEGQVLPAADEPCNQADDNCNGVTDDGCACTEGDTLACFSGPPTERNIGACHEGTQRCVSGAWSPTCQGEVLSHPETCNGQDDDCDGTADEGLGQTSCGLGPCQHTVDACVDGSPQVCDPLEGATTEICDGQNNDCDTETDEGCDCRGPVTVLDRV